MNHTFESSLTGKTVYVGFDDATECDVTVAGMRTIADRIAAGTATITDADRLRRLAMIVRRQGITLDELVDEAMCAAQPPPASSNVVAFRRGK